MKRLAIIAALALVYCKSTTAADSKDCDLTGVQQLTISHGTTPSFGWAACGLSGITVSETSITKWSVAARDSDAVPPPVLYGVKPVQADTQYVPPSALVAGHTYHLILLGHPPHAAPGDNVVLKDTTFTP